MPHAFPSGLTIDAPRRRDGRKNASRLWLGPVLAGALMLLAACGSSRDRAMEKALEAQTLLDAGDAASAREAILKAIAYRDDVPEIHILSARIALRLNEPLSAYQAYSQALDLDTTNREALIAASELALQLGRVSEAETLADKVLVLDPGQPRALLVKGLIALDRKRVADTLALADQILAIAPSDEGGLVLKARALATDGKFDEAREVIELGASRIGRTEAVLSTLLEIDRALRDAPRLRRSFEDLMAKLPRRNELRVDYANLLYKTGDTRIARIVLSGVFTGTGASRKTLEDIRSLWLEYDASPLTPDQIEAIAQRGSTVQREVLARYFLGTGRPDLAMASIGSPARGQIAGLEGLYARILDTNGRRADALTIMEAILERDKTNPDALLLRAGIAAKARRNKQAIIDAQTVLRDNPENEDAYALLASALVADGQLPRARLIFEQGIKEIPQSFSLYDRYILFLYQNDDKERAMAVARTYALASPASLRGWQRLVRLCEASAAPCAEDARKGLATAQTSYWIDPRPGSPRRRGLFGRLDRTA